jgi:hypothetical protein
MSLILNNSIAGGRKQSWKAHLYTLWLRTDHVTWFRGFHRVLSLESWLCCVAELSFVCITCICDTNKQVLCNLNLNINNDSSTSTFAKEWGWWRGRVVTRWRVGPGLEMRRVWWVFIYIFFFFSTASNTGIPGPTRTVHVTMCTPTSHGHATTNTNTVTPTNDTNTITPRANATSPAPTPTDDTRDPTPRHQTHRCEVSGGNENGPKRRFWRRLGQ